MKLFYFFKQLTFSLFLCLLLVTFSSAKRSYQQKRQCKPLSLTSIHLVDRNGFSETISNKERLEQFQNIDFLSSQPYQKILRIYARDSRGNVRSVVTSYHPNGNPKQFLEILNARACGTYGEWHSNGVQGIASTIIGGSPDITLAAEKSWLFDDTSYAWDEEGHLIAQIPYFKGVLEGTSLYYHPSGQIWKKVPYVKNQMDGKVEIYKDTGELLQQVNYVLGMKQGLATRHWDQNQLASQEEYVQGRLENGQYFDKSGSLISQVVQGTGFRAIFNKEAISELQEYKMGLLDGEVKVFNSQGRLKRLYHVKNNIKHGEEIEYYDFPVSDPNQLAEPTFQPKLSFCWCEGKVQGPVKTWYSNGHLESQREMANNAKNGVSTAWYLDESLMLIEEYEQDKLIKGDYFKRGEKLPVSQVIQGKGVAMLSDAEGNFRLKITYLNGKPTE